MKKTLVASALAVVMFVPTASAIGVYKDAKNAVSIGGYVDARVFHANGDMDVVNGGSRINFGFNRQMGNDWEANVMLEWGVNPFGSSSLQYSNDGQLHSESGDFLSNRLGYIEFANDEYGTFALGKMWGTWYDVVYATDHVHLGDGNASGTYTFNKGDGSVNGTGRGDKTVQYRNTFGDVSIAVQAQFKQDKIEDINKIDIGQAPAISALKTLEYNNTYGVAVTYDATNKLTLTAGYNTGEFKAVTENNTAFTERDYIVGVGVKYGEWADEGLYFAANINKNEYHDTDAANRIIPESKGLESLVSYRFENNFRVLAAYNILDGGDEYEALYNGDKFKRQFAVLGLNYIWDENTVLYLEGQFDNSNFKGSQEAVNKLSDYDGVGIGVRYFL